MVDDEDVALLAEGVGRNIWYRSARNPASSVALLAEGVGRNDDARVSGDAWVSSPSSRRAWVEIFLRVSNILDYIIVALLAEGVGRNRNRWYAVNQFIVALLAEGVGRNPGAPRYLKRWRPVALLAEGVGRNVAFAKLY